KNRGRKAIHTLPRSFLQVKIDGRQTFFEWLSAGRYACQNERGTMAMVTHGPLKELYFGFDLRSLLVRVDFERPPQEPLAHFDALRLSFGEPPGWEIIIEHPGKAVQQVRVMREGVTRKADGVEVGIDQIVELAVPFDVLGLKADQSMQFYVE